MQQPIAEILNRLKTLVVRDEDDEPLQLVLEAPAAEAELRSYETREGIRLPDELRHFLTYANGASLFGLDIMGMQEQIYYPDEGLITFHNWGNGDFDCLATRGSRHPEGAVIFMNHSPEVTVHIEDSFSRWILRVVEEIQNKGTLLHPSDYRQRSEAGMYQHVLRELRGRDCELNR